MQSSYWGYWLVLMGVAIVGLMISVNGLTTTSTQDHYAVREILEASMLESVDYGYYRDYNEVKMNKEKFMEVFTRMMAESMSSTDTYEINFYEMFEAPPKVSVEVKSHSGANFISTSDYDVTTRESAIIQIHAENVDDINAGSNSSVIGNNGNNSGNNTNNNQSGSIINNGSNSGNEGLLADATCKEGIASTELAGMHGVAMTSRLIYDNSKLDNTTRVALPGVKFEILGEKDNYWIIQYDGKCGWVDGDYMAINLKEYIPQIEYSITNASSSIFKTYDGTNVVSIDGLTGKKLYSSEFNSFVPATYSFAKKLKIAQANASRGGDTLKIYEAYRPYSVTRYSYGKFDTLRNSNDGVKRSTSISVGANTGREYTWHPSYFLAQNLSKHNTGCAVDITISGKERQMPTDMHQLSVQAIKYYSQNAAHTPSNYSGGMQNSQAAQTLSNYMMNGTGLTDLASEWWHYQDDACHSKIGTGASFWSAV